MTGPKKNINTKGNRQKAKGKRQQATGKRQMAKYQKRAV